MEKVSKKVDSTNKDEVEQNIADLNQFSQSIISKIENTIDNSFEKFSESDKGKWKAFVFQSIEGNVVNLVKFKNNKPINTKIPLNLGGKGFETQVRSLEFKKDEFFAVKYVSNKSVNGFTIRKFIVGKFLNGVIISCQGNVLH